MTTVRELLELGFPEYAEKALKERAGQTSLCCIEMKEGKVTCSWLGKFTSKEDFEKACLICQEEMAKKLGKENEGECSVHPEFLCPFSHKEREWACKYCKASHEHPLEFLEKWFKKVK